MGLRHRVTSAEWKTFGEPINGRLLLRPKTGRMTAQFQKLIGMAPKGFRQEVIGTDDDGNPIHQNLMTLAMDPEQAYEARLWLLEQLIEEAEGAYDNGKPYQVDSELFEGIANDDKAFTHVDQAASNLGVVHDEAVEGNSNS